MNDVTAAHRSKKFFDRLSPQYQNLIRRRRFLEWMRPIIEPRMGTRVLDIGNGGLREFVSPRTLLYVGLDSSMEMLREGRDGSIEKVCGEAVQLTFRRGVFDTVFYQSLLHHLAEESFKRTVEKVKSTLLQGASCLKEDGMVMIIEPCLPRSLERVERIFFFLLRIFLFLTKQPDIFLFSVETLQRALTESGYQDIKIWKAEREKKGSQKWSSPFLGFPLLKIPLWLTPSRRTILVANKRG